ncbi:MAG: chemotaxis-specific protein-glutamate methyltransferase CheB [Leptospiraceae bacterium]|nr:chemotaxis-specific protein-glutamate methyltransferase CheB [Leptospiraceae bacterium]
MIERKKLKVVLVEDSTIVKTILKRILNNKYIEIVGTASNGEEGLKVVKETNPDVVCTDLLMPIMDGFEFTLKLMEEFPKPILVISSVVQKENEANIFNVLKAGAIDVFPKPRGNSSGDYEKIAEQLIQKIKVVSGVVVFSRKKSLQKIIKEDPNNDPGLIPLHLKGNYKIVLIGASTGGPPALQKLLKRLGSNFPIPIICIQHISEGFTKGLIDWLNYNTDLKVQVAKQGESPIAGNVYFPPDNEHLGIDVNGKFSPIKSPPYKGHRPSVSVSFYSFFEYYKKSTLAVLLTGMGDDGSDAMAMIKSGGGFTIAQDKDSSVVFGMPRVAIEMGGASIILPLDNIPGKISTLCRKL